MRFSSLNMATATYGKFKTMSHSNNPINYLIGEKKISNQLSNLLLLIKTAAELSMTTNDVLHEQCKNKGEN